MTTKRLLDRQLRKATKPDGQVDLDAFCKAVIDAYENYENALRMNEHATHLMSDELLAHRNHLEEQVAKRTQELKVALERAEEASRVKGEFLANMSHEIRTPLNGIIAATQILDGMVSDPGQQEFVHIITQSSAHLFDLVSGVLDLAKIEAGRLELDATPFNLPQLLSHMVIELGPLASRKGLLLQSDISPGLPTMVRGDKMRVRQILVNFLSNAIKFTAHGTITLRASGQPANDNYMLHIEVEDTGIGIAAERQHLLFQKFTQADASMSRRYGGSGLGLSISKHLATMMNGDVGLTSVEGKGSTFWLDVSLPIDNTPAVPEAQTGPAFGPLPPGLKVLLAEDNEFNQKVAMHMLKTLGLEVDLANNGKEAVQKTLAGNYDIILMDCQMPEMDGLAATLAIRQAESRRHPIVALTANAFDSDRQRCLAVGMDGFISKPVSQDRIKETLSKVLATQPD